MAYTKTKFHKRPFDIANGMHRCFIYYMVYNDSEYFSYNIANILDLLFEVNNVLSRRGLNKEKRIETARELINKKLYNTNTWSDETTLQYWNRVITDNNIFKKILCDIEKWSNICEDNYEEYVSEINNYINYLIVIHYDWKVDDNIIFEKSPYTRISRTYSLSIHDNNIYDSFKDIYKKMIYLNEEEFEKTCEFTYEYYSVLETLINSLVRKDYDDVVDTLNDYLTDTKDDIKNFKDLYVKSNYMKLYDIKDMLNNKYYDKANKELRIIIENENYKFHKYKFKLFKLLQVDLNNDLYQIPLSKAISDYEKYTKKYITT